MAATSPRISGTGWSWLSMKAMSTWPKTPSCFSFQLSDTRPIEPFCTATFLPLRSWKLLIEGWASTIQPPSQPLASTCMGKPLVATCMVADSPPLPMSTSPEATACMRCTSEGNITSSRSMPSGLRSAGIRKAALVVVVKAEPILTLRRFCPSTPRETMAGAASVAPAAARM